MNHNFGGLPILRVGGKDESVLRFDLGAIPASAAITSATMKLYVSDGDATVNVHRATAAWSESTVTFQSFGQKFDPAVLGKITETCHGTQKSVDLTAQAKRWVGGTQPNYGVLLESGSYRKTVFVSREGGTTAQKPKLEVCYTIPEDHCATNPCEHGGTCANTADSFVCECPAGYIGATCGELIDNCANNPCANDGTCTNGVNSYTCACPTGYTGTNCETLVDNCAGDPCQHGVCENGVGTYTCHCEPGYIGASCETLVDNCADDPCKNGGTCTNGVNSYTCSCPAGFTGVTCEINVDDCAADSCHNAGICIDGVNAFTCSCAPDWGGELCDVNLDMCSDNPCLNGASCTNGWGTYTCTCADGFDGANCQIDINDCKGDPCQNGGICVDHVASYTCDCAAGYSGASCETNVDDCAGAPCQNGGSCTDLVNGYTCDCAGGFNGANCENDINECADPSPCPNGLCTDHPGGYSCNCNAGWTGLNCDVDIDDCATATCQNGGICHDGIAGYTCECPTGYSGASCETQDAIEVTVDVGEVVIGDIYNGTATNTLTDGGLVIGPDLVLHVSHLATNSDADLLTGKTMSYAMVNDYVSPFTGATKSVSEDMAMYYVTHPAELYLLESVAGGDPTGCGEIYRTSEPRFMGTQTLRALVATTIDGNKTTHWRGVAVANVYEVVANASVTCGWGSD